MSHPVHAVTTTTFSSSPKFIEPGDVGLLSIDTPGQVASACEFCKRGSPAATTHSTPFSCWIYAVIDVLVSGSCQSVAITTIGVDCEEAVSM